MKHKYIALIILLFSSLLVACTPDIAPEDYSTNQAGQAARTVRGVILAATPVKVSGAGGELSGVGTLAGAAAGGVAGSAIGGGWRSNLLGGIGGAVIGGTIGGLAESKLTQQTGIQYQVKLSIDGSIVSVTQGSTPLLTVGQHVFVLYGDQTRVIPDNTQG